MIDERDRDALGRGRACTASCSRWVADVGLIERSAIAAAAGLAVSCSCRWARATGVDLAEVAQARRAGSRVSQAPDISAGERRELEAGLG